jgi:hypothetical protein
MSVTAGPIETLYNGYRFRSRLEAKWAVFLDTLGVKYDYEPEGYDLPVELSNSPENGIGSLKYLPDFYLPAQEVWMEIKPDVPTAVESEKAHRLAVLTGHNVYIFQGQIPYVTADTEQHELYETGGHADVLMSDGGVDNYHFWCECPSCGSLGIQFDGRSDRLKCKMPYCCDDAIWQQKKDPSYLCPVHGSNPQPGCGRMGANGDKGYNIASPRLVRAYAAARRARFEWGETPSVRH